MAASFHDQKTKRRCVKVLIAYQYFSFKGGIEHVITEQAKYLEENGYSVSILASEYLDNEPSEISHTIPIHRLNSFNLLYTKFGIPFALPYLSAKNLRKLLRLVDDAEVVNIHGHPYIFSLLVTFFAKAKRKPIILTQHNTKIRATSRFVNFVYSLSDQIIGRLNLAGADNIIVVSNETRKYVTSLSPKSSSKTVTIYNGINTKLFKPVANKKKLRIQLGLPNDMIICFTVRRITFKNGIDILLDAAAQNKDKSILFVIGGTGPDINSVQDYLIKHDLHNVKLLGLVSDKELPMYYAASDIFILPSRQGEGFPMVVLEALACGIPIIATKSGGHIEVIDEQNGILISPGNPAEIVDGIQTLKHKDLSTMSIYCRNIAQKQFTWEINVERLVSIVKRLTE